jgi:S-adenosylmethionine decarboxylase proenzyme
MLALGQQFVAELYGCDPATLDDAAAIEASLVRAAEAAGATVLGKLLHRYKPQGVSGVVVIAESHLAIHTWPEFGYAAVDLFTCGEGLHPARCFEVLKESLRAGSSSVTEIQRGLLAGTGRRATASGASYQP